jgi:uncharacterized protein involved in response to NO
MIYGYLPPVVTGYLLTAIPNWTGRLPLQGRPLIALFCLWVAGRVAVATSACLAWWFAAAVDLAFPASVAFVLAREVVAGRNWRNLRVLGPVVVLCFGDLAFHVEAHVSGVADYGPRAGLAALALLVTLVGGRIVPSSTRNWLARAAPGRLPAPFGAIDAATVCATIVALGAWTAFPNGAATAVPLALAAVAQATRLARWAGDRTLGNPLVFVSHVAYGFLPVGLALLACAALGRVPASAGVHALTVGCLGLMTMAVMSRSSLGHTGRRPLASAAARGSYALLVFAVGGRVAAAIWSAEASPLLWTAGSCWAAAFALFAFAYWRVFTGPSLTAR